MSEPLAKRTIVVCGAHAQRSSNLTSSLANRRPDGGGTRCHIKDRESFRSGTYSEIPGGGKTGLGLGG
ncbi:hypothetical protein IG631_00119 [Alternaria alternata]|nr:hypothetical protein IG631_00119 [Alternaria alternata]